MKTYLQQMSSLEIGHLEIISLWLPFFRIDTISSPVKYNL